jgi:hypothetical protein
MGFHHVLLFVMRSIHVIVDRVSTAAARAFPAACAAGMRTREQIYSGQAGLIQGPCRWFFGREPDKGADFAVAGVHRSYPGATAERELYRSHSFATGPGSAVGVVDD